MSFELTSVHDLWVKRTLKKYRRDGIDKKYLDDLIVMQQGICAFSDAPLFFDSEHGKPKKRDAFDNGSYCGTHPLYASFDHLAPGRDDQGHAIVCYTLNDIKGQLPFDCFQALRFTEPWKDLMGAWLHLAHEMAQKNSDDPQPYLDLIRSWPSSNSNELKARLVRLIVPRTITRSLSSTTQRHVKQVKVDAESILKALTTNDYHDNWYFPDPESVKVLSVEDCPEGTTGTSGSPCSNGG